MFEQHPLPRPVHSRISMSRFQAVQELAEHVRLLGPVGQQAHACCCSVIRRHDAVRITIKDHITANKVCLR